MERKIFAGDRLKRLRLAAGLKQAALAGQVGISPSYLNQIESDQRPITPPLLRRLGSALNVPEIYFADTEDIRRASQLREILGDPLFSSGGGAAAEEVADFVRTAPALADAVLELYRAYAARGGGGEAAAPRAPYDEVGDWVQGHRNHFAPLDHAAEECFEGGQFENATLAEDLKRRLRDRHGIETGADETLLEQGMFWRLDQAERRLVLAEDASLESRVFWMAHVLCRLEQRHLVEREIRRAGLSSEDARGLARITLANYFAGALMMPYRRFLSHAVAVRYDLQRLQTAFGASFEQVCHRLSTMQRPDLPGIPFYFAKTDIAGNILKRSSATRFQFSQFGGPCPLWNVYRAFGHPGDILVQLAITPDQVRYLNIARTVGRGGGSYLARPRAVAVVLGCEVRYASETVYAAGLDLANPDSADPIGPGCRACERTRCRHRSVPPAGRRLDAGTAGRGVIPYRMREEG